MSDETYTLYIVDDEQNIGKLLLCYVEDYEEFRPRAFTSAEGALAAMESDPPRACIVDMRLTGMDGISFVHRAREIVPDCVFVIHTGTLDSAMADDLRAMGITDQDMFHKPMDMGRILERIRSRLGL